MTVSAEERLIEKLWTEFQDLNRTLFEHLESVTRRVVDEAIHRGGEDVEERGE